MRPGWTKGVSALLVRWTGKRGSPRRVLTRNALWTWGGSAYTALVFFFLSPFVIMTLGKEAFGVWAVIQSLNGFLGFASFGVQPAIVHYIARNEALGDEDAVNRFINSAFMVFALGGCLVLVACALVAPMLPRLFQLPGDLVHSAQGAFIIECVTLAVTLPLAAFSAGIVGKQRYDVLTRVDLASLTLRVLLTVGVLTAGGGLIGLAMATAVSSISHVGWLAFKARKYLPKLRFAPSLAEWPAAIKLLHYGGFSLLNVLAIQLSYQTDAIVISAALGLTWVTLFSVGAKLAFSLRGMMEQVGTVLAPAIGAMHATDDRDTIKRVVTASSRIMVLVACPPTIYLFVLGGPFLERWMKDPIYREQSGPVLGIILVAVIATISAVPFGMLHMGMNRMRSLALFTLTEGVLNLVLSLALVHSLGIVGVALGTMIPAVLLRGFAMPWWNWRVLGARPGRRMLHVWLLPTCASAVTYGLMRLLYDSSASYGWWALLLASVICVGIFALCAWLLYRGVSLVLGNGAARAEA